MFSFGRVRFSWDLSFFAYTLNIPIVRKIIININKNRFIFILHCEGLILFESINLDLYYFLLYFFIETRYTYNRQEEILPSRRRSAGKTGIIKQPACVWQKSQDSIFFKEVRRAKHNVDQGLFNLTYKKKYEWLKK